MEIVDKIEKLIDESGKSINVVLKDCDIPGSSLRMWRGGKSKPGTDAIKKFAVYFGVTTDYLLGLNDTPPEPPCPALQELLDIYNTLEPPCKDMVLKHSRLLVDLDRLLKPIH